MFETEFGTGTGERAAVDNFFLEEVGFFCLESKHSFPEAIVRLSHELARVGTF